MKKKKGQEERGPKIQKINDYYIITSGKRETTITYEKLKEFKRLYCGTRTTLNMCCNKLNITRKNLYLIKTAFNITKDDVEFTDEEINSTSTNDLVKDTLESRKEKYLLELQAQEIRFMKRELDKYYKKEFFYDKIVETMNTPPIPLDFVIPKYKKSNLEALLVLSDFHVGMEFKSYVNVYNVDIFKKRFEEIINETCNEIKTNKINKIHVFTLGDLIHGLIHEKIRVESNLDIEKQIELIWSALSGALKEIAKHAEVHYYNVPGNHGRMTPDKTASIDTENFEKLYPLYLKARLQNIKNIKFHKNGKDEEIIIANISNNIVYGVHGHTKGTATTMAANLTMMLDQKPGAIFMGHKHHLEVMEHHKVDVHMSRSLCGVDSFANSIAKTSKPGQRLYIFDEKGIKYIRNIDF